MLYETVSSSHVGKVHLQPSLFAARTQANETHAHRDSHTDRAFIDSRTPASSRRLNTKIQFKASFPFRVESFSGWATLWLSLARALSLSLSFILFLCSLSVRRSRSFPARRQGRGALQGFFLLLTPPVCDRPS